MSGIEKDTPPPTGTPTNAAAAAAAAGSSGPTSSSTAMAGATSDRRIDGSGAGSSGQNATAAASHLQVGRMVNVLPRTWPGMNKQGGTGRIMAVHTSQDSNTSTVTHVDVRYVVVGGRERRVPVEYVLAAPEYEQEDGVEMTQDALSSATNKKVDQQGGAAASTAAAAASSSGPNAAVPMASSAAAGASAATAIMARRRGRHLRDRSMLLGRCGRCGSLRSDCGSCDWAELEARAQAEAKAEAEAAAGAAAGGEGSGGNEVGSSKNTKYGSSLSGSGSRRRKMKASGKRSQYRGTTSSAASSQSSSSSSDSDSDSSFDDDMALSKLKAKRERRYAKLLKETGWGNADATAGSSSGAKKKKSKSGGNSSRSSNRRRRIIADDDGSSSSSSCSESEMDTTKSSVKQQSKSTDDSNTHQRRRRYAPAPSSSDESTSNESSSSSDDMDDPILARLANLRSIRSKSDWTTSFHKRSRKSRTTSKKRFVNRYGSSTRAASVGRPSKSSSRGKSTAGKSSLESLPSEATAPEVAADESAPGTSDVIDMTEPTDASGSVPSSSLPHHPPPRAGCVDDDDNIGEIEMTQGDFEISSDEDNDNDDSGQQQEDARRREPHDDNTDEDEESDRDDNYGAYAAAVEEDDPLRLDSTFIQPEGQQAAQSLPEDTVDRTKSISYASLPTFFDDCANKIENEDLPDARIRVEELGMAIREMRRGKRFDGSDASGKSPADLENEALLLFNSLRRTLIRDGTDQCRSALRRLTDRKERRQAKAMAKSKGLSSDEFRRIKQIGKGMDMRELRMDFLDESVEQVLRKCHDLLDGFIVRDSPSASLRPTKQAGLGGGELSGDGESEDDGYGNDSDQERSPAELNINDTSAALGGDDVELGRYDPHMHASRKRKKKRQSNGIAKPSTQRDRASSFLSGDKRKRAKIKSKGSDVEVMDDPEMQDDDIVLFRDEKVHGLTKRHSQALSKRRRKGKKSRVTSGTSDMEDEEGDNDNNFINNDISDEEMAPMEARPLDHDLRPRLSHSAREVGARSSRGLSVSFLDDDGCFDIAEGRSRQEATKSASDRMQEFLDKNLSNASIADSNTLAQPYGSRNKTSTQRTGRRQINGSGGGDRNRPPRAGGRSSGHSSHREDIPTVEALFEDLASHRPSNAAIVGRSTLASTENVPPERSNVPPGASVSDLCKRLLDAYPTSPRSCRDVLRRLETSLSANAPFRGETDNEHSRGAKIVFKTLSKVLEEYGRSTLLDIIINGPSDQARTLHLALLTTTISLIASKANAALRPENSSAQKLFGPSSQDSFVEEILLQVIDVLYAQFLPQAWANCANGKTSSSVWKELRALTDVIGKVLPTVETASRLLVSRFASQSWYPSSFDEGESGMFVSAINPRSYESFLKTGERAPVESSNVRFTMFKMALPRCEIKALWMIIAFFGKSSSVAPSTSQWYRYKHVVRRLFYSEAAVLSGGALSSSISKPSLPPCKQHISTCETELLRLSVLLRSGALDPLPDQDGILTSLVQKAISLQADSIRHDASGSSRFLPPHNSKQYKSLQRRLWDASDISSSGVSPVDDVEMSFLRGLMLVASDDSWNDGISELAPFRGILSPCLALTASWMERLPHDKKARWIRLRKDMDKLVTMLIDKAAGLEKDEHKTVTSTPGGKDQVEADFESEFASALPNSQGSSNAGSSAASAYYRESASIIFVATSTLMARTMWRAPGSEPAFDENLRNRIWQMVSSESSRQRQDNIRKGRCSDQQRARSDDFFLSLTASKVMTALAFLHLGVGSSDADPLSVDAKVDRLTFIFLCIVSSLDGICDIFLSENKRSDSASLFPLRNEAASFRPTVGMCIASIGSMCTWLTSLLSRARYALSQGQSDVSLRDSIHHLAEHCVQMVVPTLEKACICLVKVKQTDPQSDLSFRASLAVLRNGIGLAHEAKKDIASESPNAGPTGTVQGCDAAAPPPTLPLTASNTTNNDSNNDNDMFGGLDDEAFLNIDLDNLTGQTATSNTASVVQAPAAAQSVNGQLDELAKGKIWSLLTNALDVSKPSQRFAIETRIQSAHSSASLLCSSAGKMLCARNAGAVCSTLTALCSLRTAGSVHFSAFEDIFRGRRSALHATDQQSRLSDVAYLKHIGQCFCYELCRCATSLESCQAIVGSGVEQILGHFLEALVDTEILHRLPSSNKDIISLKGGPKAQDKEIKYLKRMLRRSPSGDQDDEAVGTRLLDDETFDSPGPAFMSSRLWSFSRLLGDAISRTAVLTPHQQHEALRDIANVLSHSDSDLGADMQESCLRSLTLVPLISMERECMKRFMKLRGIVSAILSQRRAVDRVGQNTIALLTKTILQNMYYLSATVEYNDRRTDDWSANSNADPEDLYERARALALQRTYTEGASACFAWILREGSRCHCCQQELNRPMMLLIKDVVLRTSLQRSGTGFCAALESQATTSTFAFDLLSSQKGTSAHKGTQSNRLAEDLAAGLGRRMHELTLYAAAMFNSSSSSDVLSLLIESALDTEGTESTDIDSNKASMLGHALKGKPSNSDPLFGGNTIRSEDLQRAIDAYVSVVRRSRDLSKQDIALLGRLRRVGVRNFFIPKLCFPRIAPEKKDRILQIMCSMFDVGKDAQACYSIRPNEEREGFLDVADLCLAAKGLIYVLKETITLRNTSNCTAIQTIFRIAKLLIQFPFSKSPADGGEALLTWVGSKRFDEGGDAYLSAKFLFLFSRWMNSMARLLTSDGGLELIHRIAANADSKDETEASLRSNRWNLEALGESELELGDGLQQRRLVESAKSMIEIAELLDSLEDAIYPEQRHAAAATSVRNVYAQRPVSSMTPLSSQGVPTARGEESRPMLTLSPRCRRDVKEYIAKYLALS